MNAYGYMLIDKLSYILIIFGAVHCGTIGFIRLNLINYLTNAILDIPYINRYIYMCIGIAAIRLVFKKDYYLPFLGKTMLPCSTLSLKTPANASIATTIKTKPNVNVIYWVIDNEDDMEVRDRPWKVYDIYSNSGVALSDNNGYAVLKVRSPNSSKSHINYRVCTSGGMLSMIKTIYFV